MRQREGDQGLDVPDRSHDHRGRVDHGQEGEDGADGVDHAGGGKVDGSGQGHAAPYDADAHRLAQQADEHQPGDLGDHRADNGVAALQHPEPLQDRAQAVEEEGQGGVAETHQGGPTFRLGTLGVGDEKDAGDDDDNAAEGPQGGALPEEGDADHGGEQRRGVLDGLSPGGADLVDGSQEEDAAEKGADGPQDDEGGNGREGNRQPAGAVAGHPDHKQERHHGELLHGHRRVDVRVDEPPLHQRGHETPHDAPGDGVDDSRSHHGQCGPAATSGSNAAGGGVVGTVRGRGDRPVAPAPPGSLGRQHLDLDAVRHLLAEGAMQAVGELHGQRVFPGIELDGGLRLPLTVMQVGLVRRNHLPAAHGALVEQDVVMPRPGDHAGFGRLDRHALHAHHHLHRAPHLGAILGLDEVDALFLCRCVSRECEKTDKCRGGKPKKPESVHYELLSSRVTQTLPTAGVLRKLRTLRLPFGVKCGLRGHDDVESYCLQGMQADVTLTHE